MAWTRGEASDLGSLWRTSVPSSISRYQSLVWHMGPGYLRGGMIRGFSREADRDRLISGHFHAAIVVAGAIGKVGFVCGGQGRYRLSVRAGPKPGALLRADHSRPNGVSDPELQIHFAQLIEHLDRDPVRETASLRVREVHLEGGHAAIGSEAAECGSDAL